jgi:hypothetical protein
MRTIFPVQFWPKSQRGGPDIDTTAPPVADRPWSVADMTRLRSKRCWRSLSGTTYWRHTPKVRRRLIGRKVTCKADGIPHRG